MQKGTLVKLHDRRIYNGKRCSFFKAIHDETVTIQRDNTTELFKALNEEGIKFKWLSISKGLATIL